VYIYIYIYEVSISGFTRSSIYIYDISSLRVKLAILEIRPIKLAYASNIIEIRSGISDLK